MTAKERHKEALLQYMCDPSKPFPARGKMAVGILGLAKAYQLYDYFTPAELLEIETEGLQLRRRRYSAKLARVDSGLLKEGAFGTPAAAKLAYQRFEGWSERKEYDLSPTLEGVVNMSDEQKAAADGAIEIAIKLTLDRIRDGSSDGD